MTFNELISLLTLLCSAGMLLVAFATLIIVLV